MSDERKPMTDEELDAIKGRLAAITEWPWIAFCRTGVRHRMGITNKRLFDDGDAPEVLDVVELGDNAGGIKSEADAVFIANAPTDIARLLVENERLRSEVTRLENMLAHLASRSVCQTVEGWWSAHGETFQTKKDAMQHVITKAEDEMKEAARKAVEEEERHG